MNYFCSGSSICVVEQNKPQSMMTEETCTAENNSVVYFQDFFPDSSSCSSSSNDNLSKVDPADAFFELANSPVVGYKIDSYKSVWVKQCNMCQTHTGGIVWETSYLLALYLNERIKGANSNETYGKVLEVGAGCGMLGLILACSGVVKKVVMTETTEVLKNLRENVLFNIRPKKISSRKKSNQIKSCCPSSLSVRKLRWECFETDINICDSEGSDDLCPHSFDTILGTDVIFSIKLVSPLLRTLQKMSNENTIIYLCVQIRCSDSHSLLKSKAAEFGFGYRDCSKELENIPNCTWGIALECKLIRLVPIKERIKRKKLTEEVKKLNVKKIKKLNKLKKS